MLEENLIDWILVLIYFHVISDMQDPMELDTIILDVVSEDTFKNSKVNIERYQKSIWKDI